MQKSTPNYHQIYNDIINKKYPSRKEECRFLLNKENLSVLDIIELNRRIFGISDQRTEAFNQSHRSYNKSSILMMLDYQKKNKLTNSQLAKHFKLSRNTVTKWKRLFISMTGNACENCEVENILN
ncbi:helix-turn-helix domain-containing protein [Chryseobacterium bernardetii]|uniref:Helix-turn-helix domain-containing protein n=1 Tax=Chryseobacterium bernardetii TaxID=1241978 RepID=A0A3G6THT1_9FLAO|nr:helix-turn-helix domain-containing protein [Chryseobacterium bernardetii]AZB26166.1 helix-turn-helix domain-containing protein [Chryseobacterium bernardetii]